MTDIHYNVFSLPAALMVEHDMSDKMVDDLNNHLDKLEKIKTKNLLAIN